MLEGVGSEIAYTHPGLDGKALPKCRAPLCSKKLVTVVTKHLRSFPEIRIWQNLAGFALQVGVWDKYFTLAHQSIKDIARHFHMASYLGQFFNVNKALGFRPSNPLSGMVKSNKTQEEEHIKSRPPFI